MQTFEPLTPALSPCEGEAENADVLVLALVSLGGSAALAAPLSADMIVSVPIKCLHWWIAGS